jgi:hypothetical protein
MSELFTIGSVLVAGGGVLASDNNRSTVAKLFRYVRDKCRIRYMVHNNKKKNKYNIYM